MVKVSVTAELPPEENETKVEKWDWNAVKNALDDSIRKFTVSQNGFKEDHSLMNGRLLISTIGVLFSAYAIAYDYIHPFPESRTVLIVCVVLYFITIGILTLYTSFVEKSCFATAKQSVGSDKPNIWKLSSKQKPQNEHIYILDIELTENNSKKKRKIENELTVAKYFDDNGVLSQKALYGDLCKFFLAFNNEEKKTK